MTVVKRRVDNFSAGCHPTLMPLDITKMRELREKRGLSLAQAAKAAGFAGRQQWHQIESGQRTNIELNTLEKIAEALGVKARDLLK